MEQSRGGPPRDASPGKSQYWKEDVDVLDMFQAGIPTFLRAPLVPPEGSRLREYGARVALAGVPTEIGNAYRPGPSMAPRAVRDASAQFRGPDFDLGVDILDALKIVDCGDVPVVPANQAATQAAIEAFSGQILQAGALPVLIGGEHSITIGGFRGFAAHHAGREYPLGLLSFDAHLDTGTDADLTAASPITRALEAGCSPEHVAIVGVHGSLNPREQLERARSSGMTVLGARQIEERGIAAVVQEALEVVCAEGAAFYVTFDFDSVDPAFAPGVVTPEPGGLTSRELLSAARMIGARGPGMFDLVEMAPMYDLSGITSRLACALITNLLGAFAREAGHGHKAEGAGGQN